ncbi:MAG: UDP-3-O-acyl-N-acetylglucosamine deacetylase [Rickettsiales bacterium]|jgi:UDP-3-O-[3-hydroxymyristoyl] N-acetylglucosamine deacetylase|nr:UDP-3-O-acyl-N-acetylglucosamine deacetylase [Rickettsiales bacterium]
MMQKTLGSSREIRGIGLHSGKNVIARLIPSEFEGIVFRPGGESFSWITATYENVLETNLGTTIGTRDGLSRILTIEHLMAALWACDVDNLAVELEGGEVPAMDGSSRCFIDEILDCEIVELPAVRKILRIRKKVVVEDQNGSISIKPSDKFSIDMDVSFNYGKIGDQHYFFDGNREKFRKEIASARTFCNQRDADRMREAGLALGGSLENALVFDDEGLINPQIILQEKEVVKHKVLDCVGDLFTSGYNDIRGAVVASKSGHQLNNRLMRKIFSDRNNYTVE